MSDHSPNRRLEQAQKQVQIVSDSLDRDHPNAAEVSFVASELERLEQEL